MEKLNDTGRKHQCTESCVLVIAKKQHSPLSFPFFLRGCSFLAQPEVLKLLTNLK